MDVVKKAIVSRCWPVALCCMFAFNMACKEEKKVQKQADVIGRDTMVLILTDLHLLESSLGIKIFEDGKINNTRNLIKTKIYKNYGISKEKFYKSYNFYAQQSSVIDSIFIDVISEISKRQAEQIKK